MICCEPRFHELKFILDKKNILLIEMCTIFEDLIDVMVHAILETLSF